MKTREKGFVSLFTCIMISMLLLIITMSMVTVQALQLRKSEDSEQTLRAYYAAEAGVEDAVNKVLTGAIAPGVGDNVCNTPPAAYDLPGDASWTCQKVGFSGTPTGKLSRPDEAKTVDPGNANYRSVIIEWNQNPTTTASYFDPAASLVNGNFPSAGSYSANPFVPPLELSILRYPTTTLSGSQIAARTNLQNILFVPAGNVNPSRISYPVAVGTGPVEANCGRTSRGYSVNSQPVGGYNCFITITGFSNANNYLFRVRSKYEASAYRFTFTSGPNGTGSVVQVPDGTATIDVTAQAGDTFRRTITKLPLNQSAAADLNFVIYSDTNVCKNLTVFDNSIAPLANPDC